LSIFQEGTVNNFQFNYWCFPLGNIASSTSLNNPFGITQFGIPTAKIATTAVSILASNAYDGTANPFVISPFWINKFTAVNTSYSDWVKVGSASAINAGEGFMMKGTSGTDETTVDGV
jgi:hypothetical protein